MSSFMKNWDSWIKNARQLSFEDTQFEEPIVYKIIEDNYIGNYVACLSLAALLLLIGVENPKISGLFALVVYPLITPSCIWKFCSWSSLWSFHQNPTVAAFALSSLILSDELNYSMIPALLWTFIFPSKVFHAKPVLISIMVAAFTIFVCYYQMQKIGTEIQTSYDTVYRPSFGILWYIDGLVFTEYRSYITGLYTCLSVIAPVIVSITSNLGEHRTSVSIKLSLLVNVYFSKVVRFGDLLFLLLELLHHQDIFQELRYPLWALTMTITPFIISPFLYNSWVSHGVGNANYLFFVGFFSWVFFGLFLVDIVGAILHIETKLSEQSKTKIQ